MIIAVDGPTSSGLRKAGVRFSTHCGRLTGIAQLTHADPKMTSGTADSAHTYKNGPD